LGSRGDQPGMSTTSCLREGQRKGSAWFFSPEKKKPGEASNSGKWFREDGLGGVVVGGGGGWGGGDSAREAAAVWDQKKLKFGQDKKQAVIFT